MQRFGEKLRYLRKRDGMTLKQLAQATGLTTHSHISNIENGRKNPSLEFVIKVSELFDVPVDHLVKDDFELE
jgi:transcriptional regulator with XRE-family HTH domain